MPTSSLRDPINLATWFPRLAATGVPVPRTVIVPGPPDLINLLDGQPVAGFAAFVAALRAAADRLGYPAFLRTGHTSHKHGWSGTCFLEAPQTLPQHIVNLVEFSCLADLCDLPTDTWVVREFLRLRHAFQAFDDMPVATERRYFLQDGRVVCHHPYWPRDVFQQHPTHHLPATWEQDLAALNHETDAEVAFLTAQSRRVAAAFPGAWSLDWALATDGTWYSIDMAPAAVSYHSPGCPCAAALIGARA